MLTFIINQHSTIKSKMKELSINQTSLKAINLQIQTKIIVPLQRQLKIRKAMQNKEVIMEKAQIKRRSLLQIVNKTTFNLIILIIFLIYS